MISSTHCQLIELSFQTPSHLQTRCVGVEMVFSNLKTIFHTKNHHTKTKVTCIDEEYRNLNEKSFISRVNMYNAPFGECFRPVLFTVQLTGLLPVDCNENGSFRFRVTSLKYLYSVAVGLTILALSIISLYKAIHDNMEFGKIVVFIFYFVDFLVVMQFQILAMQWADIMIVWNDFERRLDNNEQLLGKRFSLKVLFQLIIVSVTAMTVIAEILGVIAGLERGEQCVEVDGKFQRYFRKVYPQVFGYIEYSLWKGILIQIVQFYCTFVRMFLDVFLVFISIGLCRLIARLNLQFGVPRSNRTLTDNFWMRYKERFLEFMNLVEFVDKRFGHVIILCFLSDLYLICIRILKSLQSMDTVRQAFFFWYALLFLIMRLVWVCIAASNLHEEAKRPLIILRKVPASCWSLEAQRFQDLVTHNDVCLSGIGYFKLRRTILLSVRLNLLIIKCKHYFLIKSSPLQISGVIVTYELVLMQFNDSGSLQSTDKDVCT